MRNVFVKVASFILAASAPALCSQPAFDSAADSAYNNGWTQGSNGGYGWGGGWNLITSPQKQYIIGDSTTNGNGDLDGDGDVNTPRAAGGRAWGMPYGEAARTFSGPLSVGQTFGIDLDDAGSLSTGSAVFLINGSNAVAIGVLAAAPDYLLRFPDGTGLDTGVAESFEGIHLAFTQLQGSVQVALTPYAAGESGAVFNVPYSGQLVGVDFQSSAGFFPPPSSTTPYINNISITPEPSSAGLAAVVGFLVLVRRRRR